MTGNQLEEIPTTLDTFDRAATRSMAAFILGCMPKRRRPRRWTGWIGDQHVWRWRKVIVPDGRVGHIYGCLRALCIVRLDAPFSIEGFKDQIFRVSELRLYKHPAAVTLGQAKRGARERKSERKAAAARKNGCLPPRPGSRPRGRPRRGDFQVK
jgi:hypothetical protein